MSNKIIFNADDFGISLGVNQAIVKAYNEGVLNSASLMVNQKYAKDAVKLHKDMPNLALGLHVNLTNEYSTAKAEDIFLLVDKNGKFKNGFLKLFLLSMLRPRKFKQQAKIEIEAQIQKAIKMGVNLSHIDSHRHVHMIPAVFDIFKEMMAKYGIKKTRVMNENLFMTLKTNKNKSYLFDGGLVKYGLLLLFSMINSYKSKTYFYTMLYTCKLSKDKFESVHIPKGYDAVEVMIHPSVTMTDKSHKEDIFDENVISDWRLKELETLTDKSILNNFVFNAEYPFLWGIYKKIESWWFKLNQKVRFVLVGGFNTVFAYMVFALLFALIGMPYLWALIVQYFITINVSVLTMRYYVFKSEGDFWSEFCKAWSVYIFMFVFNSLALSFLVEICRLNELVAQALYLVVSTILTYILHKYFSFMRKN
ncbi:MAG: ChbG/HpnK family deacetylase [Alphaproteobacteria bacterium]|nr:ChbG/HpnK family deacetylase [Alphaproteobacteria bacterium]